jgi:hypothetical protein
MADNGNEGKEEKATEEKPVVKEDSINLKVKDQVMRRSSATKTLTLISAFPGEARSP